MDLPNHFAKFVENISLDATRGRRIEGALNNLRSFLVNDVLGNLVTGEIFTQGSYSYGTVTRPIKEGAEYDVDVVLPVDARHRPEHKRSPVEFLTYIKSRLDTHTSYAGKVRQQHKCVRIHYYGDFHLDLVPAHGLMPHQGCYIPDRDSGDWIRTYPAEYTQWVNSLDAGFAQGRFTRTVKMLKRWRDSAFASSRAPSSIILTTLTGYLSPASIDPSKLPFESAFKQVPSDAAFLLDTVRYMDIRLEELRDGITLSNPVHREENLAEDWDLEDYNLFRTRLATLRRRIERAYQHRDRARSVKLWQEAFPDGFPYRPRLSTRLT